MNAARQVAGAAGVGGAVDQALEQAQQGTGFDLNARDFPAARGEGGSAGTRINAEHVSLDDAAEALSRSRYEMSQTGPVHVITPMVMPKGGRLRAMIPVIALVLIGIAGGVVLLPFDLSFAVFGPHYWLLVLVAAAFLWWRQGMVMVPEGCTALISRFGKVEAEVGPGRVTLWIPWKRVSYIVNTTREYPFNAPIRSAPTKSGVQASVDLFLQFRIVSAREFVFVLGAVQGFQDKLNNAISETTRSLIYEQEASGIYDLVGESTARLLEQLNAQFAPAVELTTANITHAEPSAQEYRMDLAAPEMIRVAKEAYTYDYELGLKKEQNEGDLNKDLASLNENLSAIQADIARYQAQMDTALERETNRANAVARQRFVESESEANANAALLEAQALDIRALSAASRRRSSTTATSRTCSTRWRASPGRCRRSCASARSRRASTTCRSPASSSAVRAPSSSPPRTWRPSAPARPTSPPASPSARPTSSSCCRCPRRATSRSCRSPSPTSTPRARSASTRSGSR